MTIYLQVTRNSIMHAMVKQAYWQQAARSHISMSGRTKTRQQNPVVAAGDYEASYIKMAV